MINRLTHKIYLQTALSLARDLQAERDGDAARFTRMVNGHGKQVVTREIAINNIRIITKYAAKHYPATCRCLNAWMAANNFIQV